uniref:Uncharacterized protein n=1 Tax=Parascaris univalens TaxID=6257 RepID=A0A915BVD0_PARUN
LAVALLVCLFVPSAFSIPVFDSSLQRRYNSNHNEWPPDVVADDIGADSAKNVDISVNPFGKSELPTSKMMMNPWISPLARKFRLMRLSRSIRYY